MKEAITIMTSLYPIRQRTCRAKPKPKRPRGGRGAARSDKKKPHGKDGASSPHGTPPSASSSSPPKSPLFGLVDRFQCLSSLDEDSIEVHFLDSLLDTDSPLMPSLCRGSPNENGVHGGSDDAASFTDDTAANTSNDDSILSYSENGGTFSSCGGRCGGNGRGGSSWVPPAISNAWDGLVSANARCWQGGSPADLDDEPTFQKELDRPAGANEATRVTKRHDNAKGGSSRFAGSSSLENKPSFADGITSKDSLSALGPVESHDRSDESEPLVGRKLFGSSGVGSGGGDGTGNVDDVGGRTSFGDDSQSTAMTCNYSNAPGAMVPPSSLRGDFHYLSSSDEEREDALGGMADESVDRRDRGNDGLPAVPRKGAGGRKKRADERHRGN